MHRRSLAARAARRYTNGVELCAPHEYHLTLADGRALTVRHAGMILTRDDEAAYLRAVREKHAVPYGLALWPAAIALAGELDARGGSDLAGLRVLELGSGTGLPGIVAAALGAARVVQTDRDAAALALCEQNGKQNGLNASAAAGRIERRLADWTEWDDDARYDLILGSDVLYADTLHDDLLDIFENNLAPGRGRVLLSDPFRAVSLHLLETMEEKGWRITMTRWNLGDLGKQGQAEGNDTRSVGVFDLSPP